MDTFVHLLIVLYSGILANFLSRKHCYRTHVTVGRLKNSRETKAAINQLRNFDRKFETEINKITTEIILDDLSSEIDFEITLK